MSFYALAALLCWRLSWRWDCSICSTHNSATTPWHHDDIHPTCIRPYSGCHHIWWQDFTACGSRVLLHAFNALPSWQEYPAKLARYYCICWQCRTACVGRVLLHVLAVCSAIRHPVRCAPISVHNAMMCMRGLQRFSRHSRVFWPAQPVAEALLNLASQTVWLMQTVTYVAASQRVELMNLCSQSWPACA
jgi:hypothetical protein